MNKLQKYAWILGLLGGALVLTFLGSYAALQEIQTAFGVVGGIGAALLIAYLWLDRDDLSTVAKAKNTSLAGGAVLLVIIALGIAIAANVLAKRYDQRWDVTSSGTFTLSEQSIKVAQGLTQPIKVSGFFALEADDVGASFEERFNSYAQHSPMLELEMIDPDAEPMLAQSNGITSRYGTVILEMGDKSRRLETDFGEEALTNALINLTAGQEHILCFTNGHGERELDNDMDEMGFGGVIIKAEGGNYTARNFSPFQQRAVPPDCEVVLVAGPSQDFLPIELEVLAAYVAEGGALMVLLEPFGLVDGAVGAATPMLARDMARYGITVGEDLVIEADPQFLQAGLDASMVMLLPESFDYHPVVNELNGFVLMELARSVEVDPNAPQGINAQVLARTTPESWAESDPMLALSGELAADESDRIGSIGVIALAEITDPSVIAIGDGLSNQPTPAAGGRVIVFGDSDFASNKLLINGQNLDLFMNAVAWLVGEEDQIAIRANQAKGGQLNASVAQLVLSVLLAMLLFPGLAVAGALTTWLMRRKL